MSRNLKCDICNRDFYTMYYYDLHRYFDHGIKDATHEKAKEAIKDDIRLQEYIQNERKKIRDSKLKEVLQNGNRR